MPIFDQGYQHWSGQLSGHAWRWLAVTRQGIRAGLKSRVLRYVLFTAWIPRWRWWSCSVSGDCSNANRAWLPTFIQFMAFLEPGLVADPKHYRVDIWRLLTEFSSR